MSYSKYINIINCSSFYWKKRASDSWVLLSAKWAFIPAVSWLYQVAFQWGNMIPDLYLINTLILIFTELAYWNNCRWVDLSLHSETLLVFYHCQDFYRTWLYIWVTRRVYYKKQELLTLREHLSSPPVFLVGSVLLMFLVFVLFYYVSLRFEFRVVMSATISP